MRPSGEQIDLFGRPARVPSRAIVWGLAALAAFAAALPAVWWESLHADEVVVVGIAPRPFGEIVDTVFVERGGAPVHFFLEHVFLAWPGGVEGLRLPSLVLFLIALPAAGLVAERLAGRTAALLVVPALALAPLAIDLATFGRMYALFLAATLWATFLALVAAERASPALWAAAGLALGALVYVHPIAPLYIGIALVSALLHGWTTLQGALRSAWTAPAAIVLVGLPFYRHSPSTLQERYDVGDGARRLRTGQGQSVAEVGWEALVPGGWAGRIAFLLLAVAGIVLLARTQPRSAVVVALWIAVPVAFFTFVPAEGTVFFSRYLLPALPFALLAIVCGTRAIADRLGAAGKVAAAAAFAALLVAEAHADVQRLRGSSSLELPRLTETVARIEENGVLFSSAGRPNLDRYVALEVDGLRRVESTCSLLVPFLEGSAAPQQGIWLFSGSEGPIARAADRIEGREDIRVEHVGSRIVVVTSVDLLPPRDLVALGLDLRGAWFAGAPGERALRGAQREARALAGECPRA